MQMSDRRSPSKIPLPRSLLERYSVRGGGGGGGGGGRGRKEFRGQRREDEEEEEVVLCPLSVNELVSMSHALCCKQVMFSVQFSELLFIIIISIRGSCLMDILEQFLRLVVVGEFFLLLLWMLSSLVCMYLCMCCKKKRMCFVQRRRRRKTIS